MRLFGKKGQDAIGARKRPERTFQLAVERMEEREVLSLSTLAIDEIQRLVSYKAQPGPKVDPALMEIYRDHQMGQPTPSGSIVGLAMGRGDRVRIEATAVGSADELARELRQIGGTGIAVHDVVVNADIPIAAIQRLSKVSNLNFARPVAAPQRHVGAVQNQGDQAMNADLARATYGVSGAGVKVGVLSDSFNAQGGYQFDVIAGDLPPDVQVLEDSPFGSDEGRAMLQLVYDVAPGSSLAFNTALGGQAAFANGILNLRSAGADVIIDDIQYFAEPFFQDGIVAKAVTQVYASGAAYYSAAGNSDEQAYQSAYNASGVDLIVGTVDFGEAHDFDPGGATDILQSISLNGPGSYIFVFQWDQPFFSASGGAASCQSDYDIFFLDQDGEAVLAAGVVNNIGGDALEIVVLTVDEATQVNMAITRFAGVDAGLMRVVAFDPVTFNEYATNSATLNPHANAIGAQGIGAAFYMNTPRFGQSPPLLEAFSSAGPNPILFGPTGVRLPAPDVRFQPVLVAPDGVSTSVPGFQPFFGTSAAAPNAGAVAALMLQANPLLTPDQLYAAMQSTAINMVPPATAQEAGFGLVDAQAAVGAVFIPILSIEPTTAANAITDVHTVRATVVNQVTGLVVSGVTVNFSVAGANGTGGSSVTGVDGVAVFSYQGLSTGLDSITASIGTFSAPVSSKLWTLIASISGRVFVDANGSGTVDPGELGIPLVTITLTGADAVGAPVTRVVQTDENGDYTFSLLTFGVYRLDETQPAAYFTGVAVAGTAGGVVLGPNTIDAISLADGETAADYLFTERGLRPEFISKRLFLSSTTSQIIPGDVTRPQDAMPMSMIPLPDSSSDSAVHIQPITPVARPFGSYAPSTPSAGGGMRTFAYVGPNETIAASNSRTYQSDPLSSTAADTQRSRPQREQAVDEAMADVDDFVVEE